MQFKISVGTNQNVKDAQPQNAQTSSVVLRKNLQRLMSQDSYSLKTEQQNLGKRRLSDHLMHPSDDQNNSIEFEQPAQQRSEELEYWLFNMQRQKKLNTSQGAQRKRFQEAKAHEGKILFGELIPRVRIKILNSIVREEVGESVQEAQELSNKSQSNQKRGSLKDSRFMQQVHLIRQVAWNKVRESGAQGANSKYAKQGTSGNGQREISSQVDRLLQNYRSLGTENYRAFVNIATLREREAERLKENKVAARSRIFSTLRIQKQDFREQYALIYSMLDEFQKKLVRLKQQKEVFSACYARECETRTALLRERNTLNREFIELKNSFFDESITSWKQKKSILFEKKQNCELSNNALLEKLLEIMDNNDKNETSQTINFRDLLENAKITCLGAIDKKERECSLRLAQIAQQALHLQGKRRRAKERRLEFEKMMENFFDELLQKRLGELLEKESLLWVFARANSSRVTNLARLVSQLPPFIDRESVSYLQEAGEIQSQLDCIREDKRNNQKSDIQTRLQIIEEVKMLEESLSSRMQQEFERVARTAATAHTTQDQITQLGKCLFGNQTVKELLYRVQYLQNSLKHNRSASMEKLRPNVQLHTTRSQSTTDKHSDSNQQLSSRRYVAFRSSPA